MKFTCLSIFCILLVSLTSFFITQIKRSLSTELNAELLAQNELPVGSFIADSSENLMWFIQISDLHISKFQDGMDQRISELREFCNHTVKAINPAVVLASGDLTDAKTATHMGSKQYHAEWSIYSDVLEKSGVKKRVPWLDIRGNHDNFNVPGVKSRKNLFRKYSSQGPFHESSYMHITTIGHLRYAFIGVDACPDQGMKRPLNFLGDLSKEEMTRLTVLDKAAMAESNYTIWFGHYPTSCIYQNQDLRHLIGSRKESLAYLSGHFHTLLDYVPRMHTIQKEHYLELELGDWKDNRLFRVAAIDHGIFSFVDVKHRDWPVILITNPKHAYYQLHLKEQSPLTSSFVRILVFSLDDITLVQVRFDDGRWRNCTQHKFNKNLFLLRWEPDHFSKGLHQIDVIAVDKSDRQKIISQPFAFDRSHIEFEFLPRLVLMPKFSSVLKIIFFTSSAFCVVPLLLVKLILKCDPDLILPTKRGFLRNWARRIGLIADFNKLFFPLVFYPIYLALGPWGVGEVMDGVYGLVFVWGVFVNGQFVPEQISYVLAFFQIAFLHFPLILTTGYALDGRHRDINKLSLRTTIASFFTHFLFMTILLGHLWFAYSFYKSFGVIAVIFGPTRAGPILITLACWFFTKSSSLK